MTISFTYNTSKSRHTLLKLLGVYCCNKSIYGLLDHSNDLYLQPFLYGVFFSKDNLNVVIHSVQAIVFCYNTTLSFQVHGYFLFFRLLLYYMTNANNVFLSILISILINIHILLSITGKIAFLYKSIKHVGTIILMLFFNNELSFTNEPSSYNANIGLCFSLNYITVILIHLFMQPHLNFIEQIRTLAQYSCPPFRTSMLFIDFDFFYHCK